MSWLVTLPSPIYIFSQNNSPTWDGNYDENKNLNCGPTCLSMVLKHLREVYIPPDSIHDAIEQQGTIGPTNETQLGNFLQSYDNIATTFYYPTETQNASHTGSLDIAYQYLYAKKPLIALGNLYLSGAQYNHWRVAKALSDTTVFLLDPWYGAEVQMTYSQFASNFRGILIGIEDSRPPVL